MSDTQLGTDVRIVISLCLLLFAALFAVVVAKIVDSCHDRISIRDDVSDISENTRNLLKARLVVNRLLKRQSKKDKAFEKAESIARTWRVKTLRGTLRPNEDIENTDLRVDNFSVLDVMKLNEKSNSKSGVTTKQVGSKATFGDLVALKTANNVETEAIPGSEQLTSLQSEHMPATGGLSSNEPKILQSKPVLSTVNDLTKRATVFQTGNIRTPSDINTASDANTASDVNTAREVNTAIEVKTTSQNFAADANNVTVVNETNTVKNAANSNTVSVISRPNSRRTSASRASASSTSRFMSLFKSGTGDEKNSEPIDKSGAKSMTAVEVAVLDLT